MTTADGNEERVTEQRADVDRILARDGERTVDGRLTSEMSAAELDDNRDRTELRNRYYGLLQELRVVLPGVQVLVAFLLTAPFSSRFEDLDGIGVAIYLVALTSSVAATVCLVAPTVYHRAGGRTARSARLVWALRMTRAGLCLMALALLAAVVCVTRFVTDNIVAALISSTLGALLIVAWVVLPLLTAHPSTEER